MKIRDLKPKAQSVLVKRESGKVKLAQAQALREPPEKKTVPVSCDRRVATDIDGVRSGRENLKKIKNAAERW